MNKPTFAYLGLAAALLSSVVSCSSDPNPFETIAESPRKNNSFIKLDLKVIETRAGNLSTANESEIKKATIYVFNEKHELETTKSNVLIGAGNNSVTLEVSNGLKTIYVFTAQSGINPATGTSLVNFENMKFTSTIDKLKTNDGFVMAGKSHEQQVMISSSQEDMPASNVFAIELVRLAAKAQVKSSGLSGKSFGINLGDVSFKACQTISHMRVVHNGSDIYDSYVDGNNNGTYDNYSLEESSPFLEAVTTDFTADGCVYMPENIVSKPLSGNTTFLTVRISTIPEKYYSFSEADQAPKASSETPSAGTTYFAVGILDREHGVSDYAIDKASNHVITFKSQEDAQKYMSALNTGVVSPITVSQTESKLKAPAVRAEESRSLQFEVFEFTSGYTYYRVNIAHEEKSGDSTVLKNKVVRNKFYKVNINSVSSLGYSAPTFLRPSKADAVLDAAGSSWVTASFEVADWDEVIQNVDL